MVTGDVTVQCFNQRLPRCRKTLVGQRRELVGVVLSRDHRPQHPPPARPKHVGDYRTELHVGVFQHLLNAQFVRHHLPH